MHVVLRRYRMRLGAIEAAARRARQLLLPLLERISGFHSYYLVSEGEGAFASIAMFRTRAGAEEGEKLCVEWFRADWPTFRAIPPEVPVGEVLVAGRTEVDAALEVADGFPRLERRSGADRRWVADRRKGPDRRAQPAQEAAG